MAEKKDPKSRQKKTLCPLLSAVWPEFIEGAHHRIIAKKFNDLATGKINRLIVNMPPRHTLSLSLHLSLLPAWMVGRDS